MIHYNVDVSETQTATYLNKNLTLDKITFEFEFNKCGQ